MRCHPIYTVLGIFKLKFEYHLTHKFLFSELCKNQSTNVIKYVEFECLVWVFLRGGVVLFVEFYGVLGDWIRCLRVRKQGQKNGTGERDIDVKYGIFW